MGFENQTNLERFKRHFEFLKSLNIFGTSQKIDNEYNEEDEQNELSDFLNFLYSNPNNAIQSAIMDNKSSLNVANDRNNSTGFFNNDTFQSEELPVALIQLIILILVFSILLFLCKCNRIMEFLRDKFEKNNSEINDDIYKEHKTFWDYIESFWYDLKMKRRLRKRRKRRRLKNQGSFNRSRSYAFKSKRNNSKEENVYRNNSAIFKRRSAIYRNNRKQRNTDSFNSISSFNKSKKKPNQFRNQTNYSFTNSINSPQKKFNYDSTDITRPISPCSQHPIDEIV